MTGPAPQPPADSPAAAAWAEALRAAAFGLRLVLLFLAPLYLLSGLTRVQQDERAIPVVFGRAADTVWTPGLHWTWPRPIAEVRRINVSVVRSLDHMPLPQPAQPGDMPTPPEMDAWMHMLLTGDAHLIRAHWRLRYRVDNPRPWLLEERDPEARLAMEFAHAVTRVTAARAVDAALRTEVESYRAEIAEALERRLADRDLGVRIERVEAAALRPPGPVEQAFELVIAAENERGASLNAARGYAARVEQEGLGEVARRIARAAGERRRTVESAHADAEYFQRILPAYRERPDFVRRTLWQEAAGRTLARVRDRYILPPPGAPRELRVWLGPEARALKLRRIEPDAPRESH